MAAALLGGVHAQVNGAQSGSSSASTPKPAAEDPAKIFARGEAALADKNLDKAEHAFKSVIAMAPTFSPAYANLGVVYMRRQQWDAALRNLQKAAKLDPKMAGVRLDIGLVYFKQNDFRHAIPPLESVLKDDPSSAQARYLLGLAYFYTERWVEATDELQTLWPAQSNNTAYLYVLSIAAEHADRKELSERAAARLTEVGGDSPEFHLIVGRAKLNEEAYDDAVKELTTAAEANPKLPLVHYYLALALEKKNNYTAAKDEFLKDIALEPDEVSNYDEIGNVYFQLHEDVESEKAYQHALRLDGKLVSSYLGLAKLYTREGQNEKALAALDAAGKLDPASTNIPYMRGQVLIKLGRNEEGKRELDRSIAMSNANREKRRQELEAPGAPSSTSPQ